MLTTKLLIAALKEFPPDSIPLAVYHVEGYGTIHDEIPWVSNNNGRPEIKTSLFLDELERIDRQHEDERQLDLFPVDVDAILAAL